MTSQMTQTVPSELPYVSQEIMSVYTKNATKCLTWLVTKRHQLVSRQRNQDWKYRYQLPTADQH
ncbi:MAG: hypothetical protein ACI9CU_001611 [Polaribacter sp.]|jgi:hypothetical protein